MRQKFKTIRSPFSVNYEVTTVCNLRCEFCFAESECRLKHPPFEHVRKIIDELARAEVFEIRLFGGEFFCYPHWASVVEYVDRKGIFMSFVSNGTLITPGKVSVLNQHGIKGGAISIHGTEDVHDAITGIKGSYRRALAGLGACLDGGLEITVLSTITRANKDRLPELLADLNQRGLVRPTLSYGVNRLCPYGRGKDDWRNSKISLKDYLKLFPMLDEIHRQYGIEAAFGDAFPNCLVAKKYHHLIQGCWQGTGFGHISSTGEVRGCATAAGSYGNLLQTPLEKIWQGNKLRQFRNLAWLPEKCHACEEFCGGGCSASRPSQAMYTADEFLGRLT